MYDKLECPVGKQRESQKEYENTMSKKKTTKQKQKRKGQNSVNRFAGTESLIVKRWTLILNNNSHRHLHYCWESSSRFKKTKSFLGPFSPTGPKSIRE